MDGFFLIISIPFQFNNTIVTNNYGTNIKENNLINKYFEENNLIILQNADYLIVLNEKNQLKCF